MKGYCLRCKEEKEITLHHILPRAHFKGSKRRASLCRDCHDEIEVIIQTMEGKDRSGRRKQLPNEYYFLIFDMFIGKL